MLVKIIEGRNKGRTFRAYGGRFYPGAHAGWGRVGIDVLIQRNSTKGVGGYTADILIENLKPIDAEAKALFEKLSDEQEQHRRAMSRDLDAETLRAEQRMGC